VDKNRLWVIGSVLVMAVVVAFGWLLGVQPQLAAISAADNERATVEATNASHEVLLAKLKNDFKDIDRLNTQLASLSQSVPSGTDIPPFVDQLDALAGKEGVSLTGITVSDAQPYTPVVAPAAPVAAPAAGSTPTPTPTPAPSPGATTAPAPVLTAGVPPVTSTKITAENFAAMAVQITIKGSYSKVLNFVHGLQTGTRLFLVSGLTTTASDPVLADTSKSPSASTATPDTKGGVSATISGLVYVLVAPAKASAPVAG